MEIIYLPKSRLLQQLKDLLRDYRRFHQNSAEQTEGSDIEKASQVAEDFFQAAFGHRHTLSADYLCGDEESEIINAMSSWIEQCMPHIYYDGSPDQPDAQTGSADSETACTVLLNKLMSDARDNSSGLSWPFVERVKYDAKKSTRRLLLTFGRVFLKADILSKGLVLVDLPGTCINGSGFEVNMLIQTPQGCATSTPPGPRSRRGKY